MIKKIPQDFKNGSRYSQFHVYVIFLNFFDYSMGLNYGY